MGMVNLGTWRGLKQNNIRIHLFRSCGLNSSCSWYFTAMASGEHVEFWCSMKEGTFSDKISDYQLLMDCAAYNYLIKLAPVF